MQRRTEALSSWNLESVNQLNDFSGLLAKNPSIDEVQFQTISQYILLRLENIRGCCPDLKSLPDLTYSSFLPAGE